MKLRVVSDGTVTGTSVYDEDTFANLSGRVRAVHFRHRAGNLPEVELELNVVEINAYGAQVRWEFPGVGRVKAVTLEDGTVVELDLLGLRDEAPPP